MSQHTKHVLFSGVILCIVSTFAVAEAPMHVDDAGSLDQGGLKLESIFSRDGKEKTAAAAFGYGLIKNVEVGLAYTTAFDTTESPNTRILTPALNIKWIPFQNETGWSVGVSAAYERSRLNNHAANEKTTETSTSLTGLASYHVAHTEQVLHLNVGGAHNTATGEKRENIMTWGLGVEQPVIKNLVLVAETFGETHTDPNYAVGLRYDIAKGLKISGGLGKGNNRTFGQAGFAWEF